jgi:tetratricopeptide (TPR) repeat protein
VQRGQIEAEALTLLGIAANMQGDIDAAIRLTREAIPIAAEFFGSSHPITASAKESLAVYLAGRGDVQEAERLYREAIAIYRRGTGDDSEAIISAYQNLGHLLVGEERFDEAEQILRANAARARRVFAQEHHLWAETDSQVGRLLVRMGRYQEAERHLVASAAVYARLLPADHVDATRPHHELGIIYLARGDGPRAEAAFRTALRGAFPEDHPRRGQFLGGLGESLVMQHRFAEAEDVLLRTLRIAEAADLPRDVTLTRDRLVRLYQAWGRPAEARRYRDAA